MYFFHDTDAPILVLQCCHRLLRVVLDRGVYSIVADNTSGHVQRRRFTNILLQVLHFDIWFVNHIRLSPFMFFYVYLFSYYSTRHVVFSYSDSAWFDCVTVLFELNPAVIESEIGLYLQICLSHEPVTFTFLLCFAFKVNCVQNTYICGVISVGRRAR